MNILKRWYFEWLDKNAPKKHTEVKGVGLGRDGSYQVIKAAVERARELVKTDIIDSLVESEVRAKVGKATDDRSVYNILIRDTDLLDKLIEGINRKQLK